MRLFIQIRDGELFEHPIMDWNFAQAFPHLDMDNLPPEFMEFIRVPEPDIAVGTYEVPFSYYKIVDGKARDFWETRPMTDEEKTLKCEQLAAIQAALSEAQKLYDQGGFQDLSVPGSEPDVVV